MDRDNSVVKSWDKVNVEWQESMWGWGWGRMEDIYNAFNNKGKLKKKRNQSSKKWIIVMVKGL